MRTFKIHSFDSNTGIAIALSVRSETVNKIVFTVLNSLTELKRGQLVNLMDIYELSQPGTVHEFVS
jgi:hypothetical protein